MFAVTIFLVLLYSTFTESYNQNHQIYQVKNDFFFLHKNIKNDFVTFSNKKEIKVVVLLSLFLIMYSYYISSFSQANFLLNKSFIQDFVSNNISVFFFFILILTVLTIVEKENEITSDYLLILLLSSFGMLLLINGFNLIIIYLNIELQGLCFYILCTFNREKLSTEAGLKYFILGAFSSGLLLYGCAMIYGFSGSINLDEINTLFLNTDILLSSGIVIGVIFLMAGLLFKIGSVPFHMWVPDVYQGAPTVTTAFFAIVPKIVLFSLLAKVFIYSFFFFAYEWKYIMVLICISSIALPSIAGIYQLKVKRLFAYSAVGHVGFILVGLSSGIYEGLQSSIFYLMAYTIMSIGLFNIILSVQKKDKPFYYLNSFINMNKVNQMLAFMFTIILFSMVGIPPLVGFFSKLYVFFSAIEAGLYILAVSGLVLSVISCFYYIRLIKIMYFENLDIYFCYKEVNYENSIILSMSFLFVITYFLSPSLCLLLTNKLALGYILLL